MTRIKGVLFEDKPDWVGAKIMRFLLQSPAILLTATYVLISGLGLLYQYVLFDSFGINVIDYAKSEDLFLVAFKNPIAILIGLAIGASIWFYRFIAQYAKQRKNRIMRFMLLWFSFIGLFRREILIPLGVVYFLFFYVFVVQLEANHLVNRANDMVRVVIKGDGDVLALLPIGSTGSFLFGFELNDALKAARTTKAGSKVKPVVHAIAFSEIARLDYNNSQFDVGGY